MYLTYIHTIVVQAARVQISCIPGMIITRFLRAVLCQIVLCSMGSVRSQFSSSGGRGRIGRGVLSNLPGTRPVPVEVEMTLDI